MDASSEDINAISSSAQSAGNTCFISALPVEILRQILLHLPLFSREQLETRSLTSAPSTVAIYQVCRHWRTIVRDIPELWTMIPLPSGRWAERALRYSKPLPVTIHVDFSRVHDSEEYRKTAHRVLRQIGRARVLSFSWPPGSFPREGFTLNDRYVNYVVDMMEPLDDLPASLLESFTFADLPVFTQDLSDGIFGGDPLPHLRRLTLSHVELISAMPLLRSPLTGLKLHACSVISDDDLSDQEDEDPPEIGGPTRLVNLLDVLRGLPTLETLALRSMYFDDLDPAECPHRGIALPNLKKIDVAGVVDELSFFFGCLALPAGIDLHVECFSGRQHEYPPFLPEMCIRVAFVLHEALASAIEAGLAFQDLHVKLRHDTTTNMDILDIFTFNPRPFGRVQDAQGPAPAPTTSMHLTMKHKLQEGLAQDIMGQHATTLLFMIPAIDTLETISSDGWDIPEILKEKMGLARK